ncbi:uncharacterized protein LOC131293384 [Anopheles ziemanni]|uniref:uncharacterized protein LOC131264205 n=1 Tax=Anopheles coustani TaxID=139045 RepID=UPI0026588BF7|nr:uncharacterized protein LOC131264205 [Anopheles coustani]XP_058177445.1 uncharacterized protein LOC131293384 [Anopheles ziemanni]
MDRNKLGSRENYKLESELLKTIRNRGKYRHENHVSDSKAMLCRQVGRNGDNMFNLLVRLISRLLDNPPANAVDHFEEYCRLVKVEFLSTQRQFTRYHVEALAEKQRDLSEHIINALTQFENENIRLNSELGMMIQRDLNTMGRDVPFGYEYFISAQIGRTLRDETDVKSCQFWGVMRSLGSDYFILELEHREKTVDFSARLGVIGKHPDIITNIIDSLVDDTLLESSQSGESIRGSLLQKKLPQQMLMEILEKLDIADSEIEQDNIQKDMHLLLTELIERVSRDSLRSSASSSSDFENSCSSEPHLPTSSQQSTASLLRAQLERMQVEAQLNRRSYLVTTNPCTKPWHRLPEVTLEQIGAAERLRVFLVGDLKAKVRGPGQPFVDLEENLLRVLIAKISTHRDGHIDGSETNICLQKCLSGMYGSMTEYNHEMLQEKSDHWLKRKEQGMHYWTSENWPGLCAFLDGEQFRSSYFGWGLEKQSHWYSPIVRIPEMRAEYVAGVVLEVNEKNENELKSGDDQTVVIVNE